MSCPCTFEPAVQVDCLFEVFRIVRSGGLVDQKAEVLQHVGCVLGSLGSYLGGEPDLLTSQPEAPPAPAPATLEECVDQLETQMTAVQGLGRERAISPATWALILKLIELILTKFL